MHSSEYAVYNLYGYKYSTVQYFSLKMSAVALLLLCASLAHGQSVDLTRVAGSTGAAVVRAAVDLIQQSGVFPDDRSFLRRLAYVESRDGEHPDTFRDGYYGGIWQVNNSTAGFLDTKNTASHSNLLGIYPKIQSHFGINWPTVQWMELRKPLYSALAARLYLFNKPQIPLASNLQAQANYWKANYNTDTGTTAQLFVDDVTALEQTPAEGQSV